MMMAYNPNEDIHERHAQYVSEQNKIKDQFLSYLDKEIDKAHKHAFFRTGYPEEAEWYRFEGALVNIKEKFLSLLNNDKNESKG